MFRLCSLAVTALAFAAFVPATSEAQPREPAEGWWQWALPEIMGGEEVTTRRGQVAIPRRTPRDRDDRVAVPRGGRDYGERGDVPAFCRTGEGQLGLVAANKTFWPGRAGDGRERTQARAVLTPLG
jgi:hypothetical protein